MTITDTTPKIDRIDLLMRVRALQKEMNTKQIDREELVQILIISLFSFKHAFLLGEPGVSKTGILEIFSTVIDNGKTFDICIKNDTKYEEIFGDRFRDANGHLMYDTSNSIVESHFAIIDETWKGSSKVMNSLLSIMSGYRKIDMMGKGTIKVPLIMVGGASNELPTDVEVRPLRDRFLFSYRVKKIDNKKDWIKFASRDYDRVPELDTKFTPDEIRFVFSELNTIEIPSNIYEILFQIRQKVVLLDIGVSERKFDQAIDAFKASAYLNQRKSVNFSELFMLKHILWNEEKDIPLIKKILNDEIFGNLDVVIKYLNDMKAEQNRLNTIIKGAMSDFLKHRRQYKHEETNLFENNFRYIQEIIGNLNDLIKYSNSIIGSYNFSQRVQEETEENILSMINVSPIYVAGGVDITQVEVIINSASEQIDKLENWSSENNELYLYNMEVQKLILGSNKAS